MGSVISWFYQFAYDFNQWVNDTWTALVLQEQQHPVILAIATLIVLSLFLSFLWSLCTCCCAACCYRSNFSRYQPLYPNDKHNYAAIPSTTQPPYNPTAPSTSKGYVQPVQQV